MAYENNEKKMESVYSRRIKAGKRRTYFFDVRETRGSDYFLTITESRKRFNEDGYDRHKIFVYKEDFNKFIKALGETVDHVKTELMPDFDFDAFNHDYPESTGENTETALSATEAVPGVIVEESVSEVVDEVSTAVVQADEEAAQNNHANEEVDKW